MPLFRRSTYDRGIWSHILDEYPVVPERFDPDDVVIDVGCHIGAFCDVVARRGAGLVRGFEANRENHAGPASINLAEHPNVRLEHAAVWRSDRRGDELLFVPSGVVFNTGGGSVLFADAGAAVAAEHAAGVFDEALAPTDGSLPADRLSQHPIRTVALDDVLAVHDTVRILKIDAEGSEFPILLTSRRLDRVAVVCGEYHEHTDERMAALAPAAVVGDRRYDLPLLREVLDGAGFAVESRPLVPGRWLFTARR